MALRIKVTFPDGTVICRRNGVDTILDVLRKIGPGRFPEITLEMRKRPLVSQEKYPEFPGNYTKEICPGWYYLNQSDTRTRQAQLINIDKLLNLGLLIEVGENLETSVETAKRGGTRSKTKLVVTMPDGEILDDNSYRDVFVKCIERLGARKVSSRANFDLNKFCPLFTATDASGKRVKLDESLYVAIPTATKETAKILHLIGLRLGLTPPWKIEIRPLADFTKDEIEK